MRKTAILILPLLIALLSLGACKASKTAATDANTGASMLLQEDSIGMVTLPDKAPEDERLFKRD